MLTHTCSKYAYTHPYHILLTLLHVYTHSHPIHANTQSHTLTHTHTHALSGTTLHHKEHHTQESRCQPHALPGPSSLQPTAHAGKTLVQKQLSSVRTSSGAGAAPEAHRHAPVGHLPLTHLLSQCPWGHPPRLVLLDMWPHLTSRLSAGWKTSFLLPSLQSLPSTSMSLEVGQPPPAGPSL